MCIDFFIAYLHYILNEFVKYQTFWVLIRSSRKEYFLFFKKKQVVPSLIKKKIHPLFFNAHHTFINFSCINFQSSMDFICNRLLLLLRCFMATFTRVCTRLAHQHPYQQQQWVVWFQSKDKCDKIFCLLYPIDK
jgi:hypothetical protein